MAGAEVALPSQKDVPVAPAKLPKSGKGAFTTGMLLSKAEAKKPTALGFWDPYRNDLGIIVFYYYSRESDP